MKNEKFTTYGEYDCQLKSGHDIKLNRVLYAKANNLQNELTYILDSDYDKDLIGLQEQEQAVFKELKEKLNDWQVIAEKIALIQLAQQYTKDCKEVEEMHTTNNKYIESKDGNSVDCRISNKSYSFMIRIYEYTTYIGGKSTPIKWEVSYYFKTQRGNKLIGRVEKTFKEKDKALKYIDGRKKYFAKYFKELYQPLRSEDIEQFKSCGRLIKHYRVEE